MSTRTWKMSLGFIAVVALVLGGGVAQAATWDGGGGADQNWNTAANWVGDTVPTSSTDVRIGSASVGYTAVISPSNVDSRANRLDIYKDSTLNLASGGTAYIDWGLVLGWAGATYNWAGLQYDASRGAEHYTPFLYNDTGSGGAAQWP